MTIFKKRGKRIIYLIAESPYSTHDELRNISNVSELEQLIKINYDFNTRILGNKSAGILLLEDAIASCKLVRALNTDFLLEKGVGLKKGHREFQKTNMFIELPYYGFFEITLKIFGDLNLTFFLNKLVSCNSILNIECPKKRRKEVCKLITKELVSEFKKLYPVLYDVIHKNYFKSEQDFINFIKAISNELARELGTYPPNSFDSIPTNFWRGDVLIGRSELFTKNT
jgi:hypothetical protein